MAKQQKPQVNPDAMSAEKFAQRAYDLGLLSQRDLDTVWGHFGTRSVEAKDLHNYLLRRELLTNYQIDRVLRNERTGFFYGDYKALYFIGNGTFARVYRAAHKETGKVVALKVLRRRYSDDPKEKEKFLQEGEMGMKLRHPNIVPIYEVDSIKRQHFIVMAFIEGHSLRDFMKVRKKLTPVEATKLITDVVAGLDHAAIKGVTHCDIKLSNILVSSSGRAHLVDFGLAGVDENAEDLDAVTNARTIDYAGLERATGVRRGDPRSDIYFVGCIYYHMLCGQAPLAETRDRLQRLSVTRYREVTPITDVDATLPLAVVMVVKKAMELDPERRYESPAAMLADLKKAMAKLEGTESSENEGNDRKVMVVESEAKMQDALRGRLKKAGYRVLVISSVQRAIDRFANDHQAADALILSAGKLGRECLDAFNQLDEREGMGDLPAILLLGKNQTAWKAKAKTGVQRVVLTMPVRMSDIRLGLRKILKTPAAEKA